MRPSLPGTSEDAAGIRARPRAECWRVTWFGDGNNGPPEFEAASLTEAARGSRDAGILGSMTEAFVPAFSQLNLVVRDLAASLEFYRHLGVPAEAAPGSVHASARLPGGIQLEWDTEEFAAQWDSASRGAIGGATVLGFSVRSLQAVDDLWAELTAAGYRGHQPPYDASWGSRYAIVDDPDGNAVGLMSPPAPEHKYWPPGQAPAS